MEFAKYLKYFVLILLVSTFAYAGTELNFTETFGTANFSFDFVNNCLEIGAVATVVNNVSVSDFNSSHSFTVNGREWFCAKNFHTYTALTFRNESTDVNTIAGLRTTASISAGSNALYSFFTQLPFSVSLQETVSATNTLYCGGYVNNQYFSLTYLDDEGNVLLRSELTGGGNTQCTSARIGGFNCCDLDLGNFCAGTGSINTVTWNNTLYDDSSCSVTNETSIEGIEWVGFETSNVGVNEIFTDDINLQFINGTNALPLVNISSNFSILCINETSSVTFNISVTSFDEEGNTVLFASDFNTGNETIEVVYSDLKSFITGLSCATPSLTCGPVQNFDFIDNVIRLNNSICEVSSSIVFDSDKYNLLAGNDFFNRPVYLLSLDPQNCNETGKSYTYQTQFLFDDFIYETFIYDMNDDEQFQLSFQDQLFNDILIFDFSNDNDRFVIRNLVTPGTFSDLPVIVNVSNTLLRNQDTFGIILTTFPSNNSFDLNIAFDDVTTRFSSTLLLNNTNLMQYIRYDFFNAGNESAILQDKFNYGGIITVPGFTSTAPTNFTVTDPGVTSFTVFFSDQPNLDNARFDQVTLDVTVNFCPVFAEDLTQTPRGKSLKPLKTSLRNVCVSLDDAFTIGVFDPGEFGFCFMLGFAWILLSIIISAGLAIWINLIKKSLVLPAFFMTLSIMIIFGNVIIVYTTAFLIINAIVFAISAMILLRQLFLTGEFSGEGG